MTGSSALSAALNAYDAGASRHNDRYEQYSAQRGTGAGTSERTSVVDVPGNATTTDTLQRLQASSSTPRSASPARRYGSPYSRQGPSEMLLSASAPSAAARRRRLSSNGGASSVLSTTPPLSAIGKGPGAAGSMRASGSSPPLNTNSPIALAAAAAVTPEKLSRLLLSQGPLAIRHITSHLALTIPGFADLSLSKQRRLIIAALDAGDQTNGVAFEKVGWGRWAAKKNGDARPAAVGSATSASSAAKARRESITAHLAAQQVRPPASPVLRGASTAGMAGRWGGPDSDDVDLADDDMMFHNKPVFDDDDDDDLDDDDDDDDLDSLDDAAMYSGNHHHHQHQHQHHHAHNAHRRQASHSSMHAPPPSNGPHSRRPRTGSSGTNGRGGDTDDEDWRSMGAASLRKTSPGGTVAPRSPKIEQASPPGGFVVDLGELGVKLGPREQAAIDALVQMRSI